jgi:two-component system response regulator HydG
MPKTRSSASSSSTCPSRAPGTLVREFERRYVERVLEEHDGNVSKAARASGIARRYFMLIRARMA